MKRRNKKYKAKQKTLEDISDKYGLAYHRFAQWISDVIGHGLTFILALSVVILWLISGPFFNYSHQWQLMINTISSISTFLIVFLIQNTLNRENEIMTIKLDELLKCHKNARNSIIDLESLSDASLKKLELEYIKLAEKRKVKRK